MTEIDFPWRPWTPEQLAERLKEQPRHWYIVGGWALDLWQGVQTREHEDLEFCVLREDADGFRAQFSELLFYAAHAGRLIRLEAGQALPPAVQQFWAMDPRTSSWVFDMMIDPGDPTTWVYKRDPTIRAPREVIVWKTAAGMTFLCPAAVLLFKAKHRRPKDEADFTNARLKLSRDQRAHLSQWLALLHPNHAWLKLLTS